MRDFEEVRAIAWGAEPSAEHAVEVARADLGATLARSWAVGTGLVVAAWLFLAWPWLFGGALIPWDAKNEFYPTVRFLSEVWHSGQSAFWNPYVFGGWPLVADPQSLIFQPLFAALAWLVERPSMAALDRVELLHLLFAGLAVLGWFRIAGWSMAGGVLAAVVAMLGGDGSGPTPTCRPRRELHMARRVTALVATHTRASLVGVGDGFRPRCRVDAARA
jgi:hypothetical protein